MLPSNEQLKSELILDDIKKRQSAKEVVDVEEARVQVVIVVCGEKRYAFYGTDIREILPPSNIYWVPGLPDHLPGLVNVRGDIESIIDIRHFLGEGDAPHGDSMIALAVHGDFRSGVMIDAIDDVVEIPLSTIHPPLATLNGAARDLVIGEIEYGSETISLLDIGKLAELIALPEHGHMSAKAFPASQTE